MQTIFKPTEECFTPDIGFIETFTGGEFHPHKPQFNLDDIAHALSNNCRFNGHCRRFYSVAEHSVMVANIMERYLCEGDPLEGLLHDGSEAYMSDMPAPYKQFLPDFQEMDRAIESSLREAWGLPAAPTPACKKADWLALFVEAYTLLPSKGVIFNDPYGLREEALQIMGQFTVWCLPPENAREYFLLKYKLLQE